MDVIGGDKGVYAKWRFSQNACGDIAGFYLPGWAEPTRGGVIVVLTHFGPSKIAARSVVFSG